MTNAVALWRGHTHTYLDTFTRTYTQCSSIQRQTHTHTHTHPRQPSVTVWHKKRWWMARMIATRSPLCLTFLKCSWHSPHGAPCLPPLEALCRISQPWKTATLLSNDSHGWASESRAVAANWYSGRHRATCFKDFSCLAPPGKVSAQSQLMNS